MSDFAYTTVPGKIKDLLRKIREVGIPPKATVQWLKSIGFKSSNDKTLLGVLKFIGLVDTNNVPTPIWAQYRGSKHKQVLGDAIRKGYSELFAVYNDANQRPQGDLDHVFSTSSSGGRQVIGKTISTFKELAAEAEFGEAGQTELSVHSTPLHTPASAPPPASAATSSQRPSLHLDIQVHISADASAEQIEKVFESMAKHIYGPSRAE